jgi:cytochrome P450
MATTAVTAVAKNAPGPKPLPLLGNILDIKDNFLLSNYQNFKKYGDIVHYSLPQREVFILSSPELAQHVLVDKNPDFPKGRAMLRLLLGNGLVTNDNHESWLVQRRMMQPMFHKQRLSAVGEKIVGAVQRLLERWEGKIGQTLDLSQEMMEVTLDIITQTMFSRDVLGEVGTIGPAVAKATHFIQKRIQSPVQLPLAFPTPSNRSFQKHIGTLDALVYRLIAERRAMHERGEKPGDLLDMLLEARDADTLKAMSDEQLRDEVITIIGAGHETTANTLSFAFYVLSQHPEVLNKLRQELDTVLAGRTPTLADLQHLPYSKQVLEETLRLYPAAPSTSPRIATQDVVLNGYAIPKGGLLLINIFNIHRHPAYWEQPETFDPERWVSGEDLKHRFAYMPFGAGPRKCIGNNLAMMEGQLLLVMVVQKFLLQLAQQEVELEQAVTLRPKGGLKMSLHLRD